LHGSSGSAGAHGAGSVTQSALVDAFLDIADDSDYR
jgi:hypothetical protein